MLWGHCFMWSVHDILAGAVGSFNEHWNRRWAVAVEAISSVQPTSAEVDRGRREPAKRVEAVQCSAIPMGRCLFGHEQRPGAARAPLLLIVPSALICGSETF